MTTQSNVAVKIDVVKNGAQKTFLEDQRDSVGGNNFFL